MSQVDNSSAGSNNTSGAGTSAAGGTQPGNNVDTVVYYERPASHVTFTDRNKMSGSLVELRIDYHLNRIMKSYRLSNFANAIKTLPLQARICEKLIEIMTSSENLIDRKLAKIKEGKVMLERLLTLGRSLPSRGDMAVKDELMGSSGGSGDGGGQLWSNFKVLANSLEQISWALNSNKEHLRYIARVHVLPAVYKRSEEEHIRLKEMLVKTVEDCAEVIDLCRTLRFAYELQLRAIYGTVRLPAQQQQPLPPTAATPTSATAPAPVVGGSAGGNAGAQSPPKPPQVKKEQPPPKTVQQMMNEQDSEAVLSEECYSGVSENFSSDGSENNSIFSDSNSLSTLPSSFSEDISDSF